jgi:hypothetical protein
MAYGDKWKTKSIITIIVIAANEARAQRKWEQVLEKIKYQVDGVTIEEQLEPNWLLVEKEEEEIVNND